MGLVAPLEKTIPSIMNQGLTHQPPLDIEKIMRDDLRRQFRLVEERINQDFIRQVFDLYVYGNKK